MTETIENPRESGTGHSPRRHGQSLVEFALVLPLLLFMTAGALEIGNLLSFYLQIENAAREGARLAAMGLDDQSIGEVLGQELRNVRSDTDPNDLQVWVVRPIIARDGGTIEWNDSTTANIWGEDEEGDPIEIECVYGLPEACGGAETTTPDVPIEPDRILDDIIATGITELGSMDGIRLSVVAIYYEVDPILNLPFYPLPLTAEGFVQISTYAVMRQEVPQAAIDLVVSGCSAYPIAIDRDQVYEGSTPREGQILCNGACNNNSDFWYLAWNSDSRTIGRLNSALEPPGDDSKHPDHGYIGVPLQEPPDRALHRGDLVQVNTAASGGSGVGDALEDILDNHVETRRLLRVIVTRDDFPIPIETGEGTVSQLGISDFALIRLLPGSDGDILRIQLDRIELNCGRDPEQ